MPAFITYGGAKRQSAIGTAFGTVADVVPTFLDIAGLPPATTEFEGKTVEPVRGRSWAKYLAAESETVHPSDEATGWELFGARALRQGDWKVVHLFDGNWQLFDVAKDPGGTTDLASVGAEAAEASDRRMGSIREGRRRDPSKRGAVSSVVRDSQRRSLARPRATRTSRSRDRFRDRSEPVGNRREHLAHHRADRRFGRCERTAGERRFRVVFRL